MKELEKAGGEASALLKVAVTKSSSAEVRKLAAELLGKIDSPAVRPDELKVLRPLNRWKTSELPRPARNWRSGPPARPVTDSPSKRPPPLYA